MENLNIDSYLNRFTLDTKVQHEFQQLGIELEPYYGKVIWSLFYKKGFTEDRIRRAHEIAKSRGITKIGYLIGIIKKL